MEWQFLTPFVRSKRVINLVRMCETYKERPSTLMGITDEYLAFCLDEAITLLISRLRSKEIPHFPLEMSKTSYSRPSELYADILNKN